MRENVVLQLKQIARKIQTQRKQKRIRISDTDNADTVITILRILREQWRMLKY